MIEHYLKSFSTLRSDTSRSRWAVAKSIGLVACRV